MKKNFVALSLLFIAVLTACAGFGPAAATPTPTPTATVTPVPPPTETPTPAPTATPSYPPEGRGPSNFPMDVNPLTGLEAADPSLLERRPLAVKISNLPRSVRPQWGLSLADIVFEYYTEEGSTRFIALFYGNNADTVGPIRSARFFDAHVVRGYKAVFAFGSAYEKVLNRLFRAEFYERLVMEGPYAPLRRYDPNGYNYLVVDTAALSAYMATKNVENGRQNLDGMTFRIEAPAGSQPGGSVTVRYSGAIYCRWDYDPASGKYLRYADIANDENGGQSEQYTLQTDRLNGKTLAFDNVVVLFVLNEYYNVSPEVMDIQFSGSGAGYAFRDGQIYQVQWRRSPNEVVSLAWADGTPFPFKPGATWFEVVGLRSVVEQTADGWRFTHKMP
ncbi:MAG: hypothetical protein FD146_6 [Anaerolineaceae bacterium]|nr:MAG: hypothetical protein FD146_6 [Anaerolineaceae bacterium]